MKNLNYIQQLAKMKISAKTSSIIKLAQQDVRYTRFGLSRFINQNFDLLNLTNSPNTKMNKKHFMDNETFTACSLKKTVEDHNLHTNCIIYIT